jgi:hypothetical protein
MKTKFLSSFFVALLCLVVFSTSCKKEETTTTDIETPGTILGKWHVRSDKYFYLDTNFNLKHIGGESKYYRGEFTFDFKENGIVFVSNGDDPEPFQYEVRDSILYMGIWNPIIEKLTSKELILKDLKNASLDDNVIEKTIRTMTR